MSSAPQSDKKPAPKPTPTPNTASELTSADGSQWFDPLDVCTLRTAHLPSKHQAEFGMTRNGGKKPHQGIDLAALPGTPIRAVANGTVYMTPARNENYAYGNVLILVVGINDLPPEQAKYFNEINPGSKTIGFFYAHLSEYAVEDIDNSYNVNAGAVIGKTGCSGNAKGMNTLEQGAHLHFEIRKDFKIICQGLGNRANPLPFIKNCTNR